MRRAMKRRDVAKGCAIPKGFLITYVSFEQDQFDGIRERAEREGTSFAEQVRLLCEWGLESARDAEAVEDAA